MTENPWQHLRLAKEAGIDIHPPLENVDLKAGDQYTFRTFVERIFLIYDGKDWRLLCTYPNDGKGDRDTDEVTLL